MATAKKNMTIRVSDCDRDFIINRGHGNITEGIEAIITRYRETVKAFAPRRKFTRMELQAIAGANKGQTWAYRLTGLAGDMAANIEDYPSCEPQEAAQWEGVDYPSLAGKVLKLQGAECIALMDAIDVIFQTGKEMWEIIAAVD